MATLKFPGGFLWGAATSSHQVEGGQHNDWSEWEKLGKVEDGSVSGNACDHWNRFESDFDLAKKLGQNAHRLSLEWSRIEPRPGEWDRKAITHYQEVIKALKARNLEPFVTLWHFTNPLWLAERGGWAWGGAPKIFGRFAKKMAEVFPDVQYWMPINEANVYSILSYLIGVWPPEVAEPIQAFRVFDNLARAHGQAYRAITSVQPSAMIGSAASLIAFEPRNKHSIRDRFATYLANSYYNERWIKLVKPTSSFIGINHYTRQFVHWESWQRPVVPEFGGPNLTDYGWDIYPEGMYRVLKIAGKHKLPIYITENGLADAKDAHRERFIVEYLRQVHRAISDGIDVRGYFHWSLLDNFEWREGFSKRFGLVEVNFKTQARTVRESARAYQRIAMSNTLSIATDA